MEKEKQEAQVEQKQEGKKDEKKKKDHLAFIITIILILLLAGIGSCCFIKYGIAPADPDIAILDLLNENSNSVAKNSYEGYKNSKEVGYVLNDLLLSKKTRHILWDSKNNVYVLYDGDELIKSPIEAPSTGTDLWVYVNDIPTESRFSVYWAGTNTVTVKEDVGGLMKDVDYHYFDHVYKVTPSGDSQVYTCEEEGCGYSYSVKVIK